MPSRLKRVTKKFSMPGEAEPIVQDFIKRLKFYSSEGQFFESVVAYSLWCERVHHLTGPSFDSLESRDRMWEEIIADYGKPKKAGSFFEHRMEEILKERKSKQQQ